MQHQEGSVVTRCIAFSEPQLTGEQVLARSGVEYQAVPYGGGLGDSICQIDGEPAEYPPACWTGTSQFWAVFVARRGGAWTASSLGASSQVFRDGDTEGFRYEPPAQPIAPTVSGDCPTATPTPTAKPTPKPTAVPTPRPTPAASSQPASGPTARPSAGSTIPTQPQLTPSSSTVDGPESSVGTSPDGAVLGLASTPAASSGADPAQVDPPAGGDTGGSGLALVVAIIAIAGFGALAVVRRRPVRPR